MLSHNIYWRMLMEKMHFINQSGQQVFYLRWLVAAPKAAVVIAHGMVEHPARYDDLATFLNSSGIAVYGIYHIGHGPDAAILNHMGEGDFDRCVDHLHGLVQLAKAETGTPVFLLGHSMGSFLSQLYVTKIPGSCRPDPLRLHQGFPCGEGRCRAGKYYDCAFQGQNSPQPLYEQHGLRRLQQSLPRSPDGLRLAQPGRSAGGSICISPLLRRHLLHQLL